MASKFHLKKSLVAFLDILGFSKRFPNEKDSCIELISTFSKHNGACFDKINNNKRQIRVASLSFSDNIALSIPLEIAPKAHTDKFYVPLMSFLHAISLFSYKANDISSTTEIEILQKLNWMKNYIDNSDIR